VAQLTKRAALKAKISGLRTFLILLIKQYTKYIILLHQMAEEDEQEESAEDSKEEESVRANRFKIVISKDQMEVILRPLTNTKDLGLTTLEEIMNACESENIKVDINKKLIGVQLYDANPIEMVIGNGIRPEDGKDGYIEFKVDMSATPQFIPSEDDIVDYKAAMQITIVEIGDILADIIQPTEGEDGMNVRGEIVKPKAGSKAKYFLGDGVEEKDGHIVATISGTPSVQESVVMVRRSYILPGDVDLSTGNINYPGTVVIHGSITDGFEVISEENIVVNGLIAGAKVRAKGYIKCAGGIQGNGKAEIISGSFISAKFVNAATIVAESDVLITKDALHSNVSCLGEFRLGGSIIGGVATVFKGVDCTGLGSESGIKTTVNIRMHYRQERAKVLVNSVLAEVNVIFEKYLIWRRAKSLNEAEEEDFLQTMSRLLVLITKYQLYDSRVAKYEPMIFENKTAMARLRSILEADVTVASPYSKYTSMTPIKGPLIVTENNIYAKMAILRGGQVL